MKCNLRDKNSNIVKSYELEDDAYPTPTVVIDGTSNIIYKLMESGNSYDYYAVNYHIRGSKSEVMIGKNGLMYWERKVDDDVDVHPE